MPKVDLEAKATCCGGAVKDVQQSGDKDIYFFISVDCRAKKSNPLEEREPKQETLLAHLHTALSSWLQEVK